MTGQTTVSKDEFIEKLHQIANQHIAAGRLDEASKAMEMLGRACGFLTDKVIEIRGVGDSVQTVSINIEDGE